MALELNYNLGGVDGVLITSAYVRIESVVITHNPSKAASLTTEGRGTGTKYFIIPALQVKNAKNKIHLEYFSGRWEFAYDHTSNQNPIKQAYDFLKTLPEFSVATDVND